MTQLANLPECDDPVSLSEVFRTKEYISEVKAALKKGYTFENLAGIFTERCGVAVSARQIKYHFTRAKNRGVKGKPGKKAGESGASKNHALPLDSTVKIVAEGMKENFVASDSQTKAFSKVSGFAFENQATAITEGNVDFDAFPFGMKPKGS
jgi:hypothetical protein